jgi:uncharacterized membrane protein
MASAPTPTPASSSGMGNNVAAALSYITIVGIIFLFIEPYNKIRFVRFHAFQSIFFCVAAIAIEIGWMILTTILTMISRGFLGLILFPLSLLIYFGIVVAWVVLVVKAYGNQEFKLPIIGELAAKQVASMQ